jgi:hypothetical protein
MSKVVAVAVAIVMIACGLQTLGAQDQDRKPKVVTFHVTSVERADNSTACKSDTCNVVKYKVEGYVNSEPNPVATRYVITCDEYYSDRPHPHRNNICARFHAGNAYTANLFSDIVSFPFSGLNKTFETDYSILSEKQIPIGLGQPDVNGGSEPREATRSPERQEPAKGPEQLASKTGN